MPTLSHGIGISPIFISDVIDGKEQINISRQACILNKEKLVLALH
jgi:hypothetical protein